ncbi:MAG TPA: hypothetical protein DD719_06520 [Desulfotomaculum sp.]|nr:hypothetical protein [Desulfotomaculum sp.]HCJ79503.1 hypothetical protein [Desulfotomaculum sp.]
MRHLLSNTCFIAACSAVIAVLSFVASVCLNDVEWFQASGAIMTVGGVLLAARKIVRLELEEFMKNEKTIDGGLFEPTPEENEQSRQFDLDIRAYRWSIGLVIVGTLIWAYGGIVLRFAGVDA